MPWKRFRKKRDMPEGLWTKCKVCATTLYQKDIEKAQHVCTECGHHMRIGSYARIETLLDRDSFTEMWSDIHTMDHLEFVDKEPYPDKLAKSAKRSKLNEAAVAGRGTIEGQPLAICLLDFGFMGGSMGTVVGEKVSRTIELACAERIPAVVIACSGGARMHEGALSLMQMAKTSAALARLERQGGLYISVLSNPTTGGVMASFAALGDLILAEPGALIGFAGPRVIQETLRIELPEGFQTSEFLLEHGFIDRIVNRTALRSELARSFRFLWTYERDQIEEWQPPREPASDSEDGGESASSGEDPAPDDPQDSPTPTEPSKDSEGDETPVVQEQPADPAEVKSKSDPEPARLNGHAKKPDDLATVAARNGHARTKKPPSDRMDAASGEA